MTIPTLTHRATIIEVVCAYLLYPIPEGPEWSQVAKSLCFRVKPARRCRIETLSPRRHRAAGPLPGEGSGPVGTARWHPRAARWLSQPGTPHRRARRGTGRHDCIRHRPRLLRNRVEPGCYRSFEGYRSTPQAPGHLRSGQAGSQGACNPNVPARRTAPGPQSPRR